jgi:HSP20 family protein
MSMANITRRGDRRNVNADLAPVLAPMWSPFQIMRDLTAWDSFREMGGIASALGRAYAPSFNVKETRDAYVFTADLPGVRDEDIEISLTGNHLTVTAQREEDVQEEGDQYFTYERSYGSFTRSFALPDGADTDKAEADFKNGVLQITVGKRPEVQPRRISLLDAAKGAKEKIVEVAEAAKEKIVGASSGDQGGSKGAEKDKNRPGK